MKEILLCSTRDRKIVKIPDSEHWRTISKYLRDRGDSQVIVSFHPIFGSCVLSAKKNNDPLILRYVEKERNIEIDDCTPCFETVHEYHIAKQESTFNLINMLRKACGQKPFEQISDTLEIQDLDSNQDDQEPPPPWQAA